MVNQTTSGTRIVSSCTCQITVSGMMGYARHSNISSARESKTTIILNLIKYDLDKCILQIQKCLYLRIVNNSSNKWNIEIIICIRCIFECATYNPLLTRFYDNYELEIKKNGPKKFRKFRFYFRKSECHITIINHKL